MKLLRDKSLKQIGAYLVALMFIVFIVQYFWITRKVENLYAAERKIDFARTTQLDHEHLQLHVQLFLSGKSDLASTIASALDGQDHKLKLLTSGGRVDGTDFILKPLSRLPRITFNYLFEDYKLFKNATTSLISEQEFIEQEKVLRIDSIPTLVPVKISNPNYLKAKVRYEGLVITTSTWFEKLISDLDREVKAKEGAIRNWLSAFIILDMALLIGLYFMFLKHVLKPLKTLEQNTQNNQHTFTIPNNEIGHVAEKVNGTIENLKDATDFVTAIGEGNLSMDYKQTLDSEYTPGTNKLADSLIDMQTRLQQVNEEERKRQWANEGLAKFVDILRSNNNNINSLGDRVIAALVQYTRSKQGGLYIFNDEDENNKHLELISLFAFDIKKYVTQKIKLGEGILGQTFLEKETTHLRNVPEEFLRISTGLGEGTPKSILIVPLKVDDKVYGLVELASFADYEAHEIAFVEKLGETIASTLANVKVSQKNRDLLEQFKLQADQMRAQEEEMRQNMEELQATQEEISRKELDYIERIESLEAQLQVIPTDNSEQLKAEYLTREKEYQARIEALQLELSTKTKSDDWVLAQELADVFKINLEALKITEQELKQRPA